MNAVERRIIRAQSLFDAAGGAYTTGRIRQRRPDDRQDRCNYEGTVMLIQIKNDQALSACGVPSYQYDDQCHKSRELCPFLAASNRDHSQRDARDRNGTHHRVNASVRPSGDDPLIGHSYGSRRRRKEQHCVHKHDESDSDVSHAASI
jgi:hypothetical protein